VLSGLNGNEENDRGRHASRRLARGAPAVAIVLLSLGSARGEWPQYASDAARNAVTAVAPVNVSAQLWRADRDAVSHALVCEGASSPVVSGGRVFVNARHFSGTSYVNNKIVAFDQASGALLWERVVDKGVLNSWSSPAVDAAHGTVLIASGAKLTAVDAVSGGVSWSTPLDRIVVNPSPAVASDLATGRAFISDYDPFGGAGQLYCINTSAFDAGSNPYQPGDIVWREIVGGTSGATPAYHAGSVYVATAAGPGGFPDSGVVYAFDVTAPPASRLRWQTAVGEGFFGGVAVVEGHVYAAGYGFSGSGDNSTLAKLRESDGVIVWTVPCERTASIPVVADGRVFLAAGIQGFGSVPKVQAFADNGNSATKLWDTYVDSGGTLIVGGWTHQPVLSGSTLFVGKIPLSGDFYGAYTDLFLLDVSRTPGQADFVRQQRSGFGSSSAVTDGRVYTIGSGGLFALAARGDFSSNGLVEGMDIAGFVEALLGPPPLGPEVALGDFDSNGVVDAADGPLMVAALLGLW